MFARSVFGSCWALKSHLLHFSFPGIDFTRIAHSSGVDVVDSCIQKINSVSGTGSFSNNFVFMKRLALAESNF